MIQKNADLCRRLCTALNFEHCKGNIYFLNGNGFLEKNVSLQEKAEK